MIPALVGLLVGFQHGWVNSFHMVINMLERPSVCGINYNVIVKSVTFRCEGTSEYTIHGQLEIAD